MSSKLWDWVGGHAEYLGTALLVGLSAWSFSQGDVAGGWGVLGTAVGYFILMKVLIHLLLKAKANAAVAPQPEEPDYARLGLEPVPIPGEDPFGQFGHGPNCTYCKDWKGPRP